MSSKYAVSVPTRTSKEDNKPPRPPEKCSVEGCEIDTAVAIAVFVLPNGQRARGFYSDLASGDGFFSHFITLCSPHYLKDRLRARNAQMQQPGNVAEES